MATILLVHFNNLFVADFELILAGLFVHIYFIEYAFALQIADTFPLQAAAALVVDWFPSLQVECWSPGSGWLLSRWGSSQRRADHKVLSLAV